jgi:uncharacterized membrane protein YbaN (DUF454 family)
MLRTQAKVGFEKLSQMWRNICSLSHEKKRHWVQGMTHKTYFTFAQTYSPADHVLLLLLLLVVVVSYLGNVNLRAINTIQVSQRAGVLDLGAEDSRIHS